MKDAEKPPVEIVAEDTQTVTLEDSQPVAPAAPAAAAPATPTAEKEEGIPVQRSAPTHGRTTRIRDKTGRSDASPPPKPSRKTFDRRHWAERIGIPLTELRKPAFRALYPFEDRILDIDGHNYHYLDEGEGEPVVMVHGNPTWSFFYRKLVLGLRGSHRCLVPDHMGCGLSEKPSRYAYTLEKHIINLETWLETVLPPVSWAGGKINLVVHDWGGPIGMGYAVRNPERIRRIVVLNTSIFTAGDMPARIKICRLPVLGALLVRGLNLFSLGAGRMTTVRPLPRAVRNAFVMPYNSWADRVGVYEFVKDIPLTPDTPTHKLFRRIEDLAPDRLAGKPMLIQWGMRDWCFTPFFLNLWRKHFRHAEIDEYNAGHYLLEDAGDDILEKIGDFLERPAP